MHASIKRLVVFIISHNFRQTDTNSYDIDAQLHPVTVCPLADW
jgi:hypothetical protein